MDPNGEVERGNTAVKDSNVILFPKEKLPAPPTTMAEAQIGIDNVRKYQADMILLAILEGVYGAFEASGMPDPKDNGFREQGLIVEAIRSYLYACYEIHHPLQKFAEENFTEVQYLEDGSPIIDMHPEFQEIYGPEETENKT